MTELFHDPDPCSSVQVSYSCCSVPPADSPRLVSGPVDVSVVLNTTVRLPCYGRGTPPPTPVWTHSSLPQQPLSPGWAGQHASVTRDGTLVLTPASEDQGGSWTCSLVSEAGAAHARAWLTLVAPRDTPPPIISVPPANQTLPARTHATLHCRVQGPPTPTLTWYRGAAPVRTDGKRISVSREGDLTITSKASRLLFLFYYKCQFHRS